ncbi:MAG: 2-hydroxy-acid oxidase [Pirellulaceae bacterium]|nr:MAG: 2-hydroxy-acid oxidase [Pirellulaceae bacterium]
MTEAVTETDHDIAAPQTLDQLRDLVRELARIRPCGGRTKTALSADANLSLRNLAGLVDYEPQEFTFTARAGTPLVELEKELLRHGQFLPFDPILVQSGSTLGGAIASGMSGSGQFRYGPMRDFLVGVRFMTSDGRLIYGGGRVVKNAAGFDLPKLMVGSLGTLGIVVEATFKVFPRPLATATLRIDYPSWTEALDQLHHWMCGAWDLTALDLEPPGRVWLRLAGDATALGQRIDRCRQAAAAPVEVLENDVAYWQQVRELAFVPAGSVLVRIALTPRLIRDIEDEAERQRWGPRRYSAGGHVLWLCLPDGRAVDELDVFLKGIGRGGCAVFSAMKVPAWIGELSGGVFAERLRSVFDPLGKFRRPPVGGADQVATS